MPRVLVLGAGFAGLWAALAAARKREEIGADASDTEVLVIDRNPYHNIRVRNYEVELNDVAIPLAKLLIPSASGTGLRKSKRSMSQNNRSSSPPMAAAKPLAMTVWR